LVTLEHLANSHEVFRLVGPRSSPRWRSASPVLRRSDGVSLDSWFAQPWQARVCALRAALATAGAWSPLLRVHVPKSSGGTRPVDIPTVLDAGRLYILADWLADHAEKVLSPVAVAFRCGRQIADTVRQAQARMTTLPYASVVDIRDFFGQLGWRHVDGVIGELPAEPALQELLHQAIRTQVRDRASGHVVARTAGLPQGLSISPSLANLALTAFDRSVARAAGRLGARVLRYSDDILVSAPTSAALESTLEVVGDRLAVHRLVVKAGTGVRVDVREEPVVWLGLALSASGIAVPEAVVRAKSAQLRHAVDLGLLDAAAVEESLVARRNYYARIVGPAVADQVVASMREGIPPRDPLRKGEEDIERLQRLVTER
jgi:hypothetical protein